MPPLLPMTFVLLAWADSAPLSPRAVVAALETAVGDAVARAEPSVVAIAREKSDNDETLAIRGLDPAPVAARPPALNPGVARFDPRLGGVNVNVNINAAAADPFGTDAMSFDYGSGVVIGDKGEILTDYHVVRGARALHVRATGRQAFDAEIIAADPRSDLAVIVPKVVPGTAAPKLKPVAIGDASKLRKGSFLVALGNPFNAARDGEASASWGILSNVARRLDPSSEENARRDLQLRHYPTLLQLDSKLNLGMSGGAVVDMNGELVGLTTAAANASGFDAQAGYAIPMDALGRKVVETLKQGKEYEYGFLGIMLDDQRTNRVKGAAQGTPAALGGIQVDDAIVAVGAMPVTDLDSLVIAINSVPAGEPVTLKLVRTDARLERTVRLAKLKLTVPPIATNRPVAWRGLRVDYTSTLANATFPPEVFDAMAREGVVVTEVEDGSAAEKSGLKPGRLVSRVDGRQVRTPREFAAAVADRNGPVTLQTDQGSVTVK